MNWPDLISKSYLQTGLLSVFLVLATYSQHVCVAGPERCDLAVLVRVDSLIHQLDYPLVEQFWQTFDESCHVNVEYSEWSNELAFIVLRERPGMSLRALSGPAIRLSCIIDVLENPLLDVDLAAVIRIIAQTKDGPRTQKKKVLQVLAVAESKNERVTKGN